MNRLQDVRTAWTNGFMWNYSFKFVLCIGTQNCTPNLTPKFIATEPTTNALDRSKDSVVGKRTFELELQHAVPPINTTYVTSKLPFGNRM
eukprot:2111646-Amphidinium_carterae.1